MKTKEFTELLLEAQDKMGNGEYKSALTLLYKLREIEQKGNFDYSLTHKLYQLISNAESLHNQQELLLKLKDFSEQFEKINMEELIRNLENDKTLNLDAKTIKKELELLILRGIVNFKIQDNFLVF